jgi:hypothetical protein
MATKNSINNKTQDITIAPGTSGDSFVQFDINATGEFRIGVDDTDDSFRISQGSALGTNDTFIVTDAGEITKPLQPAFLATVTSQISNVTGDGTLYVLVWDAEVFDQGSNFDGTSTFTAPIAGRYLFEVCVGVGGITSSMTDSFCNITTSNRTYTGTLWSPARVQDSNNELSYEFAILSDMDASDTATVELQISNGTLVADIITNGATDPFSWFSGNLQC